MTSVYAELGPVLLSLGRTRDRENRFRHYPPVRQGTCNGKTRRLTDGQIQTVITDTASHPLVIAGLRRSGTTALWQTLRAHPELTAFDEPFHPWLWQGVRESTKGTWAELTALWQTGPQELAPNATAILPEDELERTMTPGQAAYISALLSQNGGRVALDVVRVFNKLHVLAAVEPRPYVVLLVRSPGPFALSHLLPSGAGTLKKQMADLARRRSALWRRSWYDNWQYETIIDKALAADHPLWTRGIAPASMLRRASALTKLLAFWWAANRTMAADLAAVAPGRHSIVLAEDFMTAPAAVVAKLLSRAGLPAATIDVGAIRAPKADPLLSAPAMSRAFARAGVPEALLPQAKPTTDTLTQALGGM